MASRRSSIVQCDFTFEHVELPPPTLFARKDLCNFFSAQPPRADSSDESDAESADGFGAKKRASDCRDGRVKRALNGASEVAHNVVRRISTSTASGRKQARLARNERAPRNDASPRADSSSRSGKGKQAATGESEDGIATSAFSERTPLSSVAETHTWAQNMQHAASNFTSYRPRRSAVSCASGCEIHRCSDLRVLAFPGMGTEPVMPDIERPGHAARAAAAAANANNERLSFVNTMLRRRDTKTQGQSQIGKAVVKDSDSAVCAMDFGEGTAVKRVDPTTMLPPEIFAQILEGLDHESLLAAEQVSWAWRRSARSKHVWREVFLKRYKPEVHVDPVPVQMGGTGIGGETTPSKPWRAMYKARCQIERNWSKGANGPAAVYFSGHTDSVYCCQFDEDKIITGSRDRTIRVWDINSYRCLKVIGGPRARPVRPANDQVLETHPVATIWDTLNLNGTPEGDSLYHIPASYHEQSILCLMFDDEIMVTGSSDSTCIVWDVKTFEPIWRLRQHTAGVLDVAFDAEHIISCSKDATICVWSRRTGQFLKCLTGHRGPVNAVQLRGRQLVSASGDGVAKLWDVETGAVLREFQSRDRGLAAVEFSDDARHVLAGGNDQVIYKYDADSARLEHTYTGHTGLVRSLFLDTANDRVLSGSYDQGMRVYEFRSGRQIAEFNDWTTSWILAAKCDYRRIVCTSQDGRALLMDFGKGVPDVELLRRKPLRADSLAVG